MKTTLIICAVIIAGICAAMVTGLCGSGKIAFTMQLDGKPLSPSVQPEVSIDGKAYLASLAFSPGSHSLTVKLANANPFSKRVWIFWGGKNIGVLPLESIKGEIVVEVSPSPASVVMRQGTEKVAEGNSPVTFKMPVGSYVIEAARGEYREYKSVEIFENQKTNLSVLLNLGSVELSASPSDAEFVLTGNEHRWQGSLPTNIIDVPVGNYSLLAHRKGWKLNSDIVVSRGVVLTNYTEFPYGSIEVTSDPTGLMVSTNGIEIGKTPITLREVMPGQYNITAADGENDIAERVNIEPKQAAKQVFLFRYGAVQLNSTPVGATVIRKGKELGKTPLTLNRIPVGETIVELQLKDYKTTNFLIRSVEGMTTNLNAKLISNRLIQAMKQAREAFGGSQFDESQKFLALALSIQPDDLAALQLQDEVAKAKAKAEEALRAEQASAKAREMASLASLDFQQIISDCTDTRQVQYPVEMYNISYETYRDYDGKYKQREVKGAPYTVMNTNTESTFNDERFAAKYIGKIYKFDSTGWKIAKIEKNGTIAFRKNSYTPKANEVSLMFGQNEIRAIPSAANLGGFLSVKDSQQITIKAKIKSHDRGDLFSRVLQRIYLENAEILAE